MQIGEFLVKLGAVADTAKVEQFGKSLAKVGAVAAVAVGTLNAAAGAAFAFLDGQIRKTEELAKTKNGLIDITQEEIAISKEYQESTKRLSGTFDVLKTKIALGVAPQMLAITERVNAFLMSNKKLITDGLQKVVGWLFDFVDGTISVFRSLSDLINKTIGWKGALLVLVGVLALVKKATIAAFITNPITWVIAAIAGLILLVDDLMTYMRGGKSLLGSYWDPFIKGIRAVKEWWNDLSGETQSFIKKIGMVTAAAGGLISFVPGLGKAFKFASSMAIKAILMLSRVMIANPIIAVIVAIASAAYLIYKNWDDLPGFFKGIWDSVVATVKWALKSVLEWFGMSSESAESTVDSIGEAFSLIFGLITYPFKQAWKLIEGLFSIWGDDSQSTVDKIGDSFSLIVDLITQPFKTAIKSVLELFGVSSEQAELVVTAIGEAFSLLFGLITYPFKQAWDLVSGLFSIWVDDSGSVVDKIGDSFSLIVDLITQPFKSAWGFVSGLFSIWASDSESVVDKIGDGFSSIAVFITKPFKGAWDFASGVLDSLVEDGKSTVSAIGKAFDSVVDFITKPFKSAFKFVSDWLGISLKQANTAVNAIGGAFKSVAGLITQPFKRAWGFVSKLFSSSESDSQSTVNKIGSAFKSVTNLITKPFKAAIKSVLEWLGLSSDQADLVVDAIGETFGLVFDLITYPFKQAWELIKGLFSIWTDDSKSTIDKIGNTFKLVTDLIKQPFKVAFDWVSEKFGFLMDAVSKGIDKLKFWKDDEVADFSVSAGLVASAIPAVGNTAASNTTKVINGGDQKIDIHVSDKEAAKVISNEIQRGGNKMAQANAQLAGGF